jgi:hypothetical protein
MSDILFHYHRVNPTTWVYLSSLLTIGLFFKFNRFWSIRNVDLLLLILYAPGLLLVNHGTENGNQWIAQTGYIWMFSVSGVFLVRLLLDPMMVRRPLLEPNLSVGGMTFIGVALLMFLMANVINSNPARSKLPSVPEPTARATVAPESQEVATPQPAVEPGYPPLHRLPRIPTQVTFASKATAPQKPGSDVVETAAARVLAIVSHVAIVLGLVLIGYRHFDNIRTGIAAAMLYLLLPYTAQFTGSVDHVLPGALLVWAIEAYRRPFVSGAFLGLAIGVAYYPMFLVPLWLAFYWPRGLMRFALGTLAALGVLVASLAFMSENTAMFWLELKQMFAWPSLAIKGTAGFWSFDLFDPVYRIPVVAAFFALSASFALWPAQKNLGTLMSCSAAVMLATQFWHPGEGGLFMAWYLPLLLLTIFRPNLEDRVALSVLGEGWRSRKRSGLTGAERAA